MESCSAGGGRYSPGIAQEGPAEPGIEYELDFWVRGDCRWVASYGAVGAKTGDGHQVASSEVTGAGWQHVQRRFRVPEDYRRMRFELSVRSAGDLWVDDVRVTPVTEVTR